MRVDTEMLNGLPGMVFECKNENGCPFTFVSKGCESLTGYAPSELKKLWDLVHPEDTSELVRLCAATLSFGKSLEYSFRIIMKDGTEKPIWIHSQVVDTDDGGMPSMFAGLLIDISRLLRVVGSVQENRSTFDFFSKVSRNIRTPLNAVMGMAELGLREDMPYKVREYTNTVKQAGEGLMTVLNDILDFTSIESGEFEIRPEEYSLSSLLNDVKNMVEDWAKAASLKFEVNVASNIPDLLMGDAFRLRRMMLQLLSNAVKFTDKGFVSLSVDGAVADDVATLTMTVEDTGRGIREEDINNIFNEYVQIDTKNIEGTGLGLPITKKVVKLMGGDIEVSSIHQVGSVFIVTIPQKISNHNKMCAIDGTDDTGKSIAFTIPGARVLIVDDIELNLRITAGLLKPYKMQLDLCKSGAEAIDAVKSDKYDLIFMDHVMPVMDGIEAVFQIRSIGFSGEACETDCKEVPIIALTANSDQAAREMFLENGFNDFLAKPVDIAHLNVIIEQWAPEDKRHSKKAVAAGTISESSIEIPGIDTAKGIAMAGGSLEYYLSILKDYHAYGLKLLKEFKTCLDKNDLETYRIHAHSLKSASGSIGADRLYIASEAFESAAKENDTSFIRDNGPKFFGELGSILQNIHPFVKDLPEPVLEQNSLDTEKTKILIIDDSPPILNILMDILKDDNFLLVARDGGIGLSIAKEYLPDLIILDLTMPGISGFDVLKSLKADDVTKGIPVILISGNDSYENQIEGYSLGAVEYIKKPFVRDIVKHRVDFNIRHIMLERKGQLKNA